jgi:hypothetical protein
MYTGKFGSICILLSTTMYLYASICCGRLSKCHWTCRLDIRGRIFIGLTEQTLVADQMSDKILWHNGPANLCIMAVLHLPYIIYYKFKVNSIADLAYFHIFCVLFFFVLCTQCCQFLSVLSILYCP